MKKILVVIAVLALGACAGTAETRATNALGIACDGFAVALDQLTPLKSAGKLSTQNIVRVDGAKKAVDQVCLPGSIVDPAVAVGVVNQGIALLNQVKEGS